MFDTAHRSWFGEARLALPLVLALVGCASAAPPPTRVHFADIARGALANYTGQAPLVVEFQAGDRVPVDLSFTGEDFELVRQGAQLELVAKQHCFVRFDAEGIRTSKDGRDFDQKPSKPGSFRIGLGSKKGEPTKLEVAIVGPRR
jgi:hypothetical protein